MTTARLLTAAMRSVPALVASAVLWLIDRGAAAVVVAFGAAALLVVGLVAPNVGAAIDRALGRAAHAIATALSRGLAAVAWLLAVLPVWGVGRIRSSNPLDAASASTAWARSGALRARAPDGVPRAPQRAGSSDTTPAGSSGRPVLTVLAAIVATALLTAGLVALGRDDDQGLTVDLAGPATDGPKQAREQAAVEYDGMPVDDYAHEDEPWAPQLFGEYEQLPYRSDFFMGHRLGDFDGRYVNTVDERRVSYTPEDPELTVWFFGGSTMFGIGQRDDHTLPSVVARLAEADGIRIRALNFGVSGYVNWQSLEQFQQALTSDELEPPDLAVFYEGLNERGLGFERVESGDVRPGSISRLATSDQEREEARSGFDNVGRLDWGDERTAIEIELAASQYRRGAELIGHLGASFDVPVVHVWQPSPFAKKPNPSDDELWRRLDYDLQYLPESTRQYRAVREQSGVDLIDLSTALDEVDRPVYFDGGHTNELGARLIGEQMYERLRPQLEELAGR